MNLTTKQQLLQFAIYLARTAGKLTLSRFRKGVDVDRKDDDSPVTVADREAEEWMRKQIGNTYPDHGIIGEEYGNEGESKSVKWILDPIDGTLSFIHGVPLYTTLIGITVDGEPEAGVIYAPATDELCEAGIGLGARYNGTDCRVRETHSLSEATLLSTDMTTIIQENLMEPFTKLLSTCRLHRTWGDAYGHMMVATGRADIMFDPLLNIWDAAPLLPILQEAGGHFLDFSGKASIESGHGFSAGETLAGKVLAVMQSRGA
ncbi:inositol monophosphatase family protein [Balneolales bacterium ANBcel1]|nr:inositol monophosphatase family protein [Balneolales bacterium ANBcel1]